MTRLTSVAGVHAVIHNDGEDILVREPADISIDGTMMTLTFRTFPKASGITSGCTIYIGRLAVTKTYAPTAYGAGDSLNVMQPVEFASVE